MLAQPCPSANVRLPSPRSDALLIFLASHSALLSLSVALPAPVWRTAYLHEITVELKTRRYIEYWIWCCRRENSAATATVPFYWDPTPPPIWMHVICARTDSRTGIATIGRTTAACAAWVSVRGAAFTRRSSRRCGDSAFLPLLLLLLLRHGQHHHSHALHIRTPTPVFLSYLILSYVIVVMSGKRPARDPSCELFVELGATDPCTASNRGRIVAFHYPYAGLVLATSNHRHS